MTLQELLGEELYKQVQAKLDEVNGKEPDKLKHIRYADLSEGNYVGKGKYDADIEKLNNLISGKDAELTTANTTIAELKKLTKGNEDAQGKIAGYEQQVSQLQAELAETKIKSEIKLALMSEKAADVDYLMFKLEEKLKESGENLTLDENGSIKGINDKISDLKVQFPKMFETAAGDDGYVVAGDNRLPSGGTHKGLTRSELLKKPYAERMELYNKDPEGYNAAMNS